MMLPKPMPLSQTCLFHLYLLNQKTECQRTENEPRHASGASRHRQAYLCPGQRGSDHKHTLVSNLLLCVATTVRPHNRSSCSEEAACEFLPRQTEEQKTKRRKQFPVLSAQAAFGALIEAAAPEALGSLLVLPFFCVAGFQAFVAAQENKTCIRPNGSNEETKVCSWRSMRRVQLHFLCILDTRIKQNRSKQPMPQDKGLC